MIRSTVLLCMGTALVFGAHVVVPFLFIGACNSGWIPTPFVLFVDMVDPAIWMIFLPFALAVIAYNYVFGHCGFSGFRRRYVARWVTAFVAALTSSLVGLPLIFNTFGS
jgi:hypothetical protein